LLFFFLVTIVQADTLHLRNGTAFAGKYLGGNQSEIWFQWQGAAPDIFPTGAIERLEFGSAQNEPLPPYGTAPSGAAWRGSARPSFLLMNVSRDACRSPYFTTALATD
jgi:hypothetical protein